MTSNGFPVLRVILILHLAVFVVTYLSTRSVTTAAVANTWLFAALAFGKCVLLLAYHLPQRRLYDLRNREADERLDGLRHFLRTLDDRATTRPNTFGVSYILSVSEWIRGMKERVGERYARGRIIAKLIGAEGAILILAGTLIMLMTLGASAEGIALSALTDLRELSREVVTVWMALGVGVVCLLIRLYVTVLIDDNVAAEIASLSRLEDMVRERLPAPGEWGETASGHRPSSASARASAG